MNSMRFGTNTLIKSAIQISLFLLLISALPLFAEEEERKDGNGEQIWMAGVATADITPREAIWMAGYASRTRPAEGTLHPIWAKALAIEDDSGHQGVLITSDLVGFAKVSADVIRDRIEEEYGLERDQIILNSSHSHTGPEIDLEKFSWRVDDAGPGQAEKLADFIEWLENRVVELVGEALQAMEPANLYAENGVTRFAVNRRNNPAGTLDQATEVAGPQDHAVPVLKVEDLDGELVAIAFGYACHPTVLAGYEWTGDYPGFAQIELEKAYPGATALFFQGAGGDQNPLPRRTIPLAEQYGRELAFAVQRVLEEEMRQLESTLQTAYSEIDLAFAPLPTKEDLESMAEEFSGYHERWARYMLDKLEQGEERITSYPYPVQLWQAGNQLIATLGGEAVVDYAIELKRIFGNDTFVLGYSNDPNMAYIPSTRVLREGGYEGHTSQRAKGFPGPWAANVQVNILHEFVRVADELGLQAAP